MRDPNLKALTVYVDKAIYDAVRVAAEEDGRSVTNFLSRLITAVHVSRTPIADLERMTGKRPSSAPPARSARQVDIEDAIVAAVKRGPVKSAKHK
jgi:hypothetical protein